MKDLNKLFNEGLEIVKETCGAHVIGNIRKVVVNTRAKTRWGLCKKYNSGGHYSGYIIEISDMILQDQVPDDATMSVIVHEILHACNGGFKHTGAWKVYADWVMSKYPNLTITRTAKAEFFGFTNNSEVIRKYAIQCVDCGMTHYSSKLSTTIKYPYRYRCARCGGKLERLY